MYCDVVVMCSGWLLGCCYGFTRVLGCCEWMLGHLYAVSKL